MIGFIWICALGLHAVDRARFRAGHSITFKRRTERQASEPGAGLCVDAPLSKRILIGIRQLLQFVNGEVRRGPKTEKSASGF